MSPSFLVKILFYTSWPFIITLASSAFICACHTLTLNQDQTVTSTDKC